MTEKLFPSIAADKDKYQPVNVCVMMMMMMMELLNVPL